jgi:hypothetical protein
LQNVVEVSAGTERWSAWYVNWSGISIGALASIAAALVFGLIGTAVGATSVKVISSWKTISFIDVAVVICAAFFSMVIGGWSAAKVTGIRHSEPAILHAVVAWLVAVPTLLILLATGAGNAFGGWYGGFVTSPLATPVTTTPDVVRNTALAALTTLLVGLIGALIGGWMASGEPMTLTHYRSRKAIYGSPKGIV